MFCDNVEQQIVYFTSDPFPLSAVVLIDNHLSIKSAEQVQKSLTAISSGFGPNDEVALVTYDQFPNTVADFSFNNDQLYTKLKRMELAYRYPGSPLGGPLTSGATANGRSLETGAPTTGGVQQEKETTDLDDAVYAAGEMLKGRGRDRRKIIFLVSDGNNSHDNEHSLDQTMQLLLKYDISVYSISVGHALLQKQSTRLERYATATGGDTFYASNDRGLEGALRIGHRTSAQSVHTHVSAARHRSRQGLSHHRSACAPSGSRRDGAARVLPERLAINFARSLPWTAQNVLQNARTKKFFFLTSLARAFID